MGHAVDIIAIAALKQSCRVNIDIFGQKKIDSAWLDPFEENSAMFD